MYASRSPSEDGLADRGERGLIGGGGEVRVAKLEGADFRATSRASHFCRVSGNKQVRRGGSPAASAQQKEKGEAQLMGDQSEGIVGRAYRRAQRQGISLQTRAGDGATAEPLVEGGTRKYESWW
jgi:hypothetical protein